MPEVRFLNLEYFFYKIYDFFASIFGGNSNVVTHRSFGQWISDTTTHTASIIYILLIIIFLVLFCVLVYTRLRRYELDQEHKAKYNDHFIAPIPPVARAGNPRWEYVEKLFASDNSNDWRMAIIEADTMLDELVASMGFVGDNLGERLKSASTTKFPTLQSAWAAHLVRNRIAHDGINFHLSDREAKMTRKHFEFVFRDMHVI